MERELNFLIDISPGLYILLFVLIIYFLYKEKDEWLLISVITLLVFIGGVPYLIRLGYGNFITAVLIQAILIIGLWLLVCLGTLCEFGKKAIRVIVIINIIYDIYSFSCMYHRMEIEKIMESKIVDDLLNYIETFDFLKLFWIIVNNQWVEGLVVGISSTVLGGLILNKIQKGK